MSRVQNEKQELTDLKIALGAYHDGLYDIAANYLRVFLKKYPKSKFTQKVSLLLASAYAKAGKVQKALEAYHSILSKGSSLSDTQRLEIHAIMYGLLKKSGKPKKAAAQLKAMANLSLDKKIKNTTSFAAFINLAKYYQQKGNAGLAEQTLNNLLSLSPPSPWKEQAMLRKVTILAAQKRFSDIYSLLKPIIRQEKYTDPVGKKFYFYWAFSNLELKRFCVAQGVFKNLILPFKDTSLLGAIIRGYITSFTKCFADEHMRDEIFQVLQKEFQKRPSILFQIYYLEGLTYYQEGVYPKAKTVWIKTLKTFPDHPGLPDILIKLDTIFHQAKDLKKWEEILLGINKSKKYLPETREVDNYLLGNFYFDLKKYETALPFYFSIMNNKKYRKFCLERIVLCYYYLKKYKEAKTNLSILLLENPQLSESPPILYLQGDLLLRSGKTENALTLFKKIVQKKRETPGSQTSIWLSKAELELGKIYYLKKDFESSKRALMDVLKQVTGNIDENRLAAFYLGLISEDEGKPELSETYFQIASLSTNSAIKTEALFRLGLAKKSLKHYKESAEIFQKIINMNDQTALKWKDLSRLQLAELYVLQKKYAKASGQIKYLIEKSKDEDIKKQAGKLFQLIKKRSQAKSTRIFQRTPTVGKLAA